MNGKLDINAFCREAFSWAGLSLPKSETASIEDRLQEYLKNEREAREAACASIAKDLDELKELFAELAKPIDGEAVEPTEAARQRYKLLGKTNEALSRIRTREFSKDKLATGFRITEQLYKFGRTRLRIIFYPHEIWTAFEFGSNPMTLTISPTAVVFVCEGIYKLTLDRSTNSIKESIMLGKKTKTFDTSLAPLENLGADVWPQLIEFGDRETTRWILEGLFKGIEWRSKRHANTDSKAVARGGPEYFDPDPEAVAQVEKFKHWLQVLDEKK